MNPIRFTQSFFSMMQNERSKKARKFKPGNCVMLRPAGIPMTVTMYVNKSTIGKGAFGELVCVTWGGINGKIKTAKFQEDMLQLFPYPEWKK
ncbi:MAG: hypothetical protein EOO13_18325 [Chitinophagaceae bacterium]|nr:MAG: hypothetical protein EOO13_18325 [Chitinophagaceae bacterium]